MSYEKPSSIREVIPLFHIQVKIKLNILFLKWLSEVTLNPGPPSVDTYILIFIKFDFHT